MRERNIKLDVYLNENEILDKKVKKNWFINFNINTISNRRI